MVILKLNTEEVAQTIAFMLRGKQFGKYVVVFKQDQPAIHLAIALTDGELLGQSCIGSIALLVISLVASHGFLSMWLLANPVNSRPPETQLNTELAAPPDSSSSSKLHSP